MGLHKEAIADFDMAFEVEPKFANARYHRGILKFTMGLYKEAIANFNAAIS